MKKKDLFLLIFIELLFLAVLFLTKRDIFFFKFDKNLVSRYFLSQDIPHEVNSKRLFLSDSDIHLAAGYLYVRGADPSLFNFEKPPLIKYLFGFSALFFNNPYYVQIVFGLLLLALTYYIGKLVYNNRLVSSGACLLLILDPVFIDLASQTMLDLNQAAFFLLYFLMTFFLKENFFVQGLALAVFAGTKFWITPIFFIGIFSIYKIYKKEFKPDKFFLHLIVAQIIYSGFYLRTFILHNGLFNIVFFQLKVFKYYLYHNASSFPGGSLIMFLTGFTKTWWGNHQFVRSNIWTPIWLIGSIAILSGLLKQIKKPKINTILLMAVTPVIYLIFLGFQVPFPRYFLIILPFFYLTLMDITFKLIKRKLI